jgi:hypothetical protein
MIGKEFFNYRFDTIFFYEKSVIVIDENWLRLWKLICEITHISVIIKHMIAKLPSIRLLKKTWYWGTSNCFHVLKKTAHRLKIIDEVLVELVDGLNYFRFWFWIEIYLLRCFFLFFRFSFTVYILQKLSIWL